MRPMTQCEEVSFPCGENVQFSTNFLALGSSPYSGALHKIPYLILAVGPVASWWLLQKGKSPRRKAKALSSPLRVKRLVFDLG